MHIGDDFLGVGPTGRPVTMRVMDFYLHHEGLIRENWVPLDILDLLRQMGVDVLARMQSHFRRGARTRTGSRCARPSYQDYEDQSLKSGRCRACANPCFAPQPAAAGVSAICASLTCISSDNSS